jgi:birA, biotin-[acetyl-CoA-carboxylase] ligase region
MINNIENPRFIHLKETDSTSQFLKTISENEELPSGSIVCADFQTAGRGQRGNTWESEAGKNLLFSILFRPSTVPANIPFVISEMISLSVKYTLDKYIPDIFVKWPNDIYHKEKKIAGMLIENTIQQEKVIQSIVGIGININQTEFRSDVPNPISMALITGHTFDIISIMEVFRHEFAVQCQHLNDNSFEHIHTEYLNSIYRKEGFHKYRDSTGIFYAEIYDIEPTGHLILKQTDGTYSRYAFKEVSYVL